MLNDTLANALSKILNGENLGRDMVRINPTSKMIKKVLEIMNEERFIGKFEEITPSRGGFLEVALLGSINKCGVVKPRYPVKLSEYEKFEKRYLPAANMGIIIVSTSKGLMIHHKAKQKNLGGKLIAYCY